MTEKEMRRLSRRQLLQLLLEQTERADDLEKKLREMEDRLEDKRLVATEAGSLAEATVRLNRVFEAADAACEQYIENIKRISKNADSFKDRLEADARARAEKIMEDADTYCARRELQAQEKIAELEQEIERLYEKRSIIEKSVGNI